MPQFNETQFMSADEKRQVLRHWSEFLRTIAAGGPNRDRWFQKFSKPLYEHLIQHCSFIAHYNRSGFFHTYFASGDGTQRFVRQFDRTANPNGASVEYGSSWWLDGDYADINAAMCDVATQFAPAIKQFAQEQQRRSDVGMAQTLAAKHNMTLVQDTAASAESTAHRH